MQKSASGEYFVGKELTENRREEAILIRHYGVSPWRAVVLHGGPGAPGSAGGLAAMAGRMAGTVEPMQSRESIAGLVDELHGQIADLVYEPFVLIGHSWGAWLAILYAARHPALVGRVVLVGAGPLDAAYVPQINERRNSRLTEAEQREYVRATVALESDGDDEEKRDALRTLEALTRKSDSYRIAAQAEPEPLPFDALQHAAVWKEAQGLRVGGGLLAAAAAVRAPLTILHGEVDPHPAAGVTEPLRKLGKTFDARIFPRCGHYPFREEYAASDFSRALRACF